MSRWGELIPHDDAAGESCLCGCNEAAQGAEVEWRDYCKAHGANPTVLDFPLVEIVQKYLIPRLDQQVTVAVIETSHNPIRVETIDGVDVSEQWYGREKESTLTPEYVEVPLSEALKIAQEETP